MHAQPRVASHRLAGGPRCPRRCVASGTASRSVGQLHGWWHFDGDHRGSTLARMFQPAPQRWPQLTELAHVLAIPIDYLGQLVETGRWVESAADEPGAGRLPL